jgi:hypothetical protein
MTNSARDPDRTRSALEVDSEPLKGSMLVGGRRFTVVRAYLAGGLQPNKPLWWRLAVFASGRWYYDRDDVVVAYSHLLTLEGQRLLSWQDAIASGFSWEESYDDACGEYWANICLGGPHDDIDDAEIRFGPTRGSRFRLTWKGIADIDPPEELEDLDEVEFFCETDAEFVGIIVSGFDQDEVPSRIREYIREPEYVNDNSRAEGVEYGYPSSQNFNGFFLPGTGD